MELQLFIEKYQPGDNLQKADEAVLQKYAGRLPEGLLELWREYGFGSYGSGIIRIINPDVYEEILYTWLGKKDEKRIPIAISAFGDLFYYRDLGSGEEDVSMLRVHYKQIEVTVWSLIDFFNDFLCDEEIITGMLGQELFQAALKEHGPLKDDEMYTFVPALALGGAEEPEYIQKAKTLVQLELLFQM